MPFFVEFWHLASKKNKIQKNISVWAEKPAKFDAYLLVPAEFTTISVTRFGKLVMVDSKIALKTAR